MTISTIFWDVGGVFTASPFYSPNPYLDGLSIGREEMLGIVFGDYGTDGDHPWHRAERGELSVKEAFAAAVETAAERGVTFAPGEFFKGMGGDTTDRSVLIDRIRTLHAGGMRHAIITNNLAEFRDAWRKMLPIELFEDIVDSHEVGLRKPDPAIFHLALKRMNVADPSSTLFLDDYPPNVAAAQGVGMHGIVVGADIDAAVAALDNLTC